MGVRSYINEELRLKALGVGQAGSLFEIIDLWVKRNEFEHASYWQGTASAWLANAMADEGLKPLLLRFTSRSIGMKFANAALIRDSGIQLVDKSTKGNEYKIDLRRDHERKTVRVKPGKR